MALWSEFSTDMLEYIAQRLQRYEGNSFYVDGYDPYIVRNSVGEEVARTDSPMIADLISHFPELSADLNELLERYNMEDDDDY